MIAKFLNTQQVNYLYQIKHINSNLFSTGGIHPTFNKFGKFWSKSSLFKHFKLVKKNSNIKVYKRCSIVCYKLVKNIKKTNEINEIFNKIINI